MGLGTRSSRLVPPRCGPPTKRRCFARVPMHRTSIAPRYHPVRTRPVSPRRVIRDPAPVRTMRDRQTTHGPGRRPIRLRVPLARVRAPGETTQWAQRLNVPLCHPCAHSHQSRGRLDAGLQNSLVPLPLPAPERPCMPCAAKSQTTTRNREADWEAPGLGTNNHRRAAADQTLVAFAYRARPSVRHPTSATIESSSKSFRVHPRRFPVAQGY